MTITKNQKSLQNHDHKRLLYAKGPRRSPALVLKVKPFRTNGKSSLYPQNIFLEMSRVQGNSWDTETILGILGNRATFNGGKAKSVLMVIVALVSLSNLQWVFSAKRLTCRFLTCCRMTLSFENLKFRNGKRTETNEDLA